MSYAYYIRFTKKRAIPFKVTLNYSISCYNKMYSKQIIFLFGCTCKVCKLSI